MSKKNGCSTCNDYNGGIEASPIRVGVPLNRFPNEAPSLIDAGCCETNPTCITNEAHPVMSPTCCYTNPCHCRRPDCTPRARIGVPFYQQTKVCKEDTRETVIIERISGVFKNTNAFAMPTCGASIRVYFKNVVDVPINSQLWASGIGVLTIIGFNPVNQEIELRNDCPQGGCEAEGQAAPGTPIPACTVFTLSRPFCSNTPGGGAASLYPYLAASFVAPEDMSCIDIALTNVNGLSVNKNISIQNGIYRLSAIKSSTIVTICNDGGGLTPGIVVQFEDAGGNLITPIILIDSNPCLNTATFSGKLLVCDNNVITPLTGTVDNQIPVLNLTTGEVNFRTLGIPVLTCTELLVCLTLDPDLPVNTSYLIQVQSTADFAAGELVIIGGTEFIIDVIDNATTLHATPVSPPTSVQTYPVGATLCSASCCAQLDLRITELEQQVTNINNNQANSCVGFNNYSFADQVDATPVSQLALPISTPVAGDDIEVEVVNSSCKYDMVINWQYDATWRYDLIGDNSSEGVDVGHFVELGIGSATNPALSVFKDIPASYAYKVPAGGTPNTMRQSRTDHFSGYLIVPPSSSRFIRIRPTFIWSAGDLVSINLISLGSRLTVIGVAVK